MDVVEAGLKSNLPEYPVRPLSEVRVHEKNDSYPSAMTKSAVTSCLLNFVSCDGSKLNPGCEEYQRQQRGGKTSTTD